MDLRQLTVATRRVAGSTGRSLTNGLSIELLVAPYRTEFYDVWPEASRVPGWLLEVNAAVMFGVIRDVKPATIVEIGSSQGRSTTFFAKSLRRLDIDGRVYAIDPHTGDRQHMESLGVDILPSYDQFIANIRAAGIEDLVTPLVQPSLDAAAEWTGPAVDFLYIDGWHSYDAVMADGRAWAPHLTKDAVVMFDDYSEYEEVKQAVVDLRQEGTVQVWGEVFGQAIGGPAGQANDSARKAIRLSALPPLHYFRR